MAFVHASFTACDQKLNRGDENGPGMSHWGEEFHVWQLSQIHLSLMVLLPVSWPHKLERLAGMDFTVQESHHYGNTVSFPRFLSPPSVVEWSVYYYSTSTRADVCSLVTILTLAWISWLLLIGSCWSQWDCSVRERSARRLTLRYVYVFEVITFIFLGVWLSKSCLP